MSSIAHLIYFSPTGTTKKIVEQIAAGMAPATTRHYNLTRLPEGLDLRLTDGIAIIGLPVYAGRLPVTCLERLEQLSGAGIPAVLVVLYGNRAYEDALVELRDLAAAKGFVVVAAGAFIGEHSYSTSDRPIAAGRPDQADLQQAWRFGATIAERLRTGKGAVDLDIPGAVPYKERPPFGGIAPDTDTERCILCGACAGVCPTFVIRVADRVVTAADNCLMCCACVRVCPEQARALTHPVTEARRDLLIRHCSAPRAPELFY